MTSLSSGEADEPDWHRCIPRLIPGRTTGGNLTSLVGQHGGERRRPEGITAGRGKRRRRLGSSVLAALEQDDVGASMLTEWPARCLLP
jgi:hypothetical protein